MGRADHIYKDACCDPSAVWAFVRGKHVIAVVAPSDLIAGNGDTHPLGADTPSAWLTFRANANRNVWKLGIVDDCGAFVVKGSDFVAGCSRIAIPK